MKTAFFIFLSLLACSLSIVGQSTVNKCPEISVIGPSAMTRAGDQMAFTASVAGAGENSKLEYDWTVTAGVIESGQGTAVIKVRTTAEMAQSNVTATVKILGIAAGCADAASETAGVEGFGCGMPLDEFGKLAKYDITPRIDNFYIRLNENPGARGLILVKLNTKESRAFKLTYLNNIYDAIPFLKYDPARVTFVVLQGDYETGTKFWLVPPAADTAALTEGGGHIKGEDFKQKIKTLFPINK